MKEDTTDCLFHKLWKLQTDSLNDLYFFLTTWDWSISLSLEDIDELKIEYDRSFNAHLLHSQ